MGRLQHLPHFGLQPGHPVLGHRCVQPVPTHPIPEPHLRRKCGDTGQNEPAVVAHDPANRRRATRRIDCVDPYYDFHHGLLRGEL